MGIFLNLILLISFAVMPTTLFSSYVRPLAAFTLVLADPCTMYLTTMVISNCWTGLLDWITGQTFELKLCVSHDFHPIRCAELGHMFDD